MANIITISREFGSGGRELGKRLADVLGYDYYDREIITEISKKYQLNEDFVEQTLNKQVWKTVPLNYGRTISYFNTMHTSHMNLLIEEKEILEKIASSNRNCIIVGRNADILLEKYNPFSIFVCADMDGTNVFEFTASKPVALLLGNEGNGVSQFAKTNCHSVVSLPMKNNLESLNVAVAGSVLMYLL